MQLSKLMFMMQFLHGAHHNLIGDKKSNWRDLMVVFFNRNKDGSLKWERGNWKELSDACDKANAEALS
jgi:hypothetical protein